MSRPSLVSFSTSSPSRSTPASHPYLAHDPNTSGTPTDFATIQSQRLVMPRAVRMATVSSISCLIRWIWERVRVRGGWRLAEVDYTGRCSSSPNWSGFGGRTGLNCYQLTNQDRTHSYKPVKDQSDCSNYQSNLHAKVLVKSIFCGGITSPRVALVSLYKRSPTSRRVSALWRHDDLLGHLRKWPSKMLNLYQIPELKRIEQYKQAKPGPIV